MADKPRVLVSMPDTPVRATMFTPKTMAMYEAFGTVIWNSLDREYTEEEYRQAITGVQYLVTGWGSVKLTDAILDSAKGLCFVGHTAGTIKYVVDESFFNRGIVICTANAAIAEAVAEYCLLVTLMSRWRFPGMLEQAKQGYWGRLDDVPPGLSGCTAGIIDYGAIARSFIALLRSLRCEIKVYAPYLKSDIAREEGFTLTSLEEALSCDVVSVHSGLTKETEHFLDAGKLALIKDGATLINSARGGVIDTDALLRELQTGRFYAALDVYEQEPLPLGHPFWSMPNIIATPHIAAGGTYWRRQQPLLILEDMERVAVGLAPVNQITLERYLRQSPSYK